MTPRTLLAVLLAVLMAASPASAAPIASSQTPGWRATAERLAPDTYVVVDLVDGTHVRGDLIEVTADHLVLRMRTRLRVPPRVIDAENIRAVTVGRESASPGRRVAVTLVAVVVTISVVCVALYIAAVRNS